MTTSTTPALDITDTLTVTGHGTSDDLTEFEAEFTAELAAATATTRESRAARRAELTEAERRTHVYGWALLVVGAIISLAAFSSIAWHDSVSANGSQHSAVVSAP